MGRITHSNLSVYENEFSQPVFSFPLVEGNLSFDLFGYANWNSQVLMINDGIAYIFANHDEGGLIEYSFDTNIGFISKLVWMETEDLTKLEMMFSLVKMTRIMQGMPLLERMI